MQTLMAALGAAAVAALCAVFAADALRGESGPPEISLEVLEVTRAGPAYVAEIRARNDGESPAANVTIEGALAGGETSQMMLDYLPDGSSREGGLIFRADPGAGGVRLRVLGYSEP